MDSMLSKPRPPLCHNKSTPDLHPPETSHSAKGMLESNTVNRYELLQSLSQQDDTYRNVVFDPSKRINNAESDYNATLGFDTITVDLDEANMEERKYEVGGRGRNLTRSSSPMNTSPSPTGKYFNSNSLSRVFSPGARMDYPTRPIITSRGCCSTKTHKDFKALYQDKLNNEENNWLKPVLPHRVIMVYISGRKHTWVALDWILNRYIEHGDSVIIVAAVPPFTQAEFRKKSDERWRNVPSSATRRMKSRHRPEVLKPLVDDIMKYSLKVLKPGVIAKISVELVVGNTKSVLKQMYRLYEPNLVSTASKENQKLGAPLKSWLSSKLTDRLVKNFPLPLIVVPAVHMSKLEINLEKKLSKEVNISKNYWFDKNRYLLNDDNLDDEYLNTSSAESIDSVDSMDSENSQESYDEIAKLFTDYRKNIREEIANLKKSERNEDYFASFLTMITDKSIQFCKDVGDIDPDFKGKGARLAREITGSTKFGTVPYKTKSLITPVEKPKLTKSVSSSTGLSFKEMQKILKERQEHNQKFPIPSINVDQEKSPSPPIEMHKRTLKFADLESPSRQNSPKSNDNSKNSKNLMKSLSHDIDVQTKRPILEPRKSHPDMQLNGTSNGSSDDLTKKKKKGRFWKLFK